MIITDINLLRTPCEDALPEEIGPIIERLEKELKLSAENGQPGIGLAAIQCNIPKNVAIIRVNSEYYVNLVNAKITKQYNLKEFYGEGCLSFPGRFEKTLRYEEIVVEENTVYPHKFIAKGLFSIVIEHEIDHWNNLLLPDFAIKQVERKIRSNDPCHCNSGLKYKRCHGK